jgi:CheY-like chemotaxis protein/anti-sigma regulatory factor (Ser/Thr protein kinase)
MLGHELRNPLASISNAAQIQRIARDRPELLDEANAILARQVRHIKRLVDDLLEVGRLTSGKIQLECEPLDLGNAVRTLLDEWKADGRLAQHHVATRLGEAWVFADHARINQITSNLLDNALKYTPAGGRIDVAVEVEQGEATLVVSDTGEGISPELATRVFDLFVQGERSLAREGGGLGIGLTVAKRLIELHGGSIRSASEGKGCGATFIVTLPAIERPQAAATQTVAPPATPRRILVVEDNPDARESLIALLQIAGHDVHGVETGQAAIDAVKARVPDAALVDIGLPDIDGYEVAQRLRALVADRPLRLIAVTGYGTHADRQRAFAAGFDAHIAKPVEPGALDALLRTTDDVSASVR